MLPMPPEHALEIERDLTAYRQAIPALDRADRLLECFLCLPWPAPRDSDHPEDVGGRYIWTGPIFPSSQSLLVSGTIGASVSEEQPKKDDHRNWHTQQPEQYASTHVLLRYWFGDNLIVEA
jgi:hypothetical protein